MNHIRNIFKRIHRDAFITHLLAVITGIIIGFIVFPFFIMFEWWEFIGSLAPEALGILFTVVILNTWAEYRAQKELKQQLLSDLHTSSNDLVLSALHRLREKNWLKANYFEGNELRRADWSNTFIGRMNFNNTILHDTKFINTTSNDNKSYTIVSFVNSKMWRVDFSKANLKKANFTNAEMIEANFMLAYLPNTNFTDAILNYTNWRKSTLAQAIFLSAKLSEAKMEDVNLESANLSRADLSSGSLENSYLVNAKLVETDLRSVNLKGCILEKADLDNATLLNADLSGAILTGCKNIGSVQWELDGQYPTTLPDGELWHAQICLEKYTEITHPEFFVTLQAINQIRLEQGQDQVIYN